jgi:hypothetical protein
MSNQPNKTPGVILHGEAMIFQSPIPEGATEIKSSSTNMHIIADSETTGNHHVIDTVPGTKYFKHGDTMYMENTNETRVRCVLADRHDAITLDPGTWEFGIQKEFDHLTQQLHNVAD